MYNNYRARECLLCGLALLGDRLSLTLQGGDSRVIAAIKNDNLAHKTDLHLTYIRFNHFKHTCYSLLTPIWYICFIGMGLLGYMLSFITKKYMILLYHLSQTVAGDTLVAATTAPLPHTCYCLHRRRHNTIHTYTNTTQLRNITYQILTGSLIYVIKLYIQSPMWLNIEYRLHVLFLRHRWVYDVINRP